MTHFQKGYIIGVIVMLVGLFLYPLGKYILQLIGVN